MLGIEASRIELDESGQPSVTAVPVFIGDGEERCRARGSCAIRSMLKVISCRTPLALDHDPPGIAVERERHSDHRLQSIALRAAGRADISLAARYPDREVEDVLDHIGRNTGAVIDEADPGTVDLYLDPGGDADLLASIERVIDQLLGGHLRPLLGLVADLGGKLTLGGKVEKA
jgi:hypothetical protein